MVPKVMSHPLALALLLGWIMVSSGCQTSAQKARFIEVSAPRPTIAYKPFPLVHPESFFPIIPETWLRMPDGTRIQAKDFYQDLNQLELQLNALGFSMRKDDPDKIIEGLRTLMESTKKYGALLEIYDEKLGRFESNNPRRFRDQPPTGKP